MITVEVLLEHYWEAGFAPVGTLRRKEEVKIDNIRESI